MKKANVPHKISKETKRIIICLTVIAFCSAILLGVVNMFTKVDEEKQLQSAIAEIYSEEIVKTIDVDGYKNLSGTTLENLFVAKDNAYIAVVHVEKSAGVCYNAKGITIVVVLKDDKIVKVESYSHSETPGLGENALKEKHLSQYKDLSVNLFDVTDNGTQGEFFTPNKVTSATYSTNGVQLGVRAAVKAYVSNK